MLIDVRDVQSANAAAPKFVSLLPLKVMLVSEAHFPNAHSPIEVTEAGMLMEASELHPLNTLTSIFVSPSGSATDLSEVQTLNAPLDITKKPFVSAVMVFTRHWVIFTLMVV